MTQCNESEMRVPVETLRVGDRVRAVEHGPIGTVDDVGRGWTIVRYSHRVRFGSSETRLPYKHGQDRLIPIDAALPGERRDG